MFSPKVHTYFCLIKHLSYRRAQCPPAKIPRIAQCTDGSEWIHRHGQANCWRQNHPGTELGLSQQPRRGKYPLAAEEPGQKETQKFLGLGNPRCRWQHGTGPAHSTRMLHISAGCKERDREKKIGGKKSHFGIVGRCVCDMRELLHMCARLQTRLCPRKPRLLPELLTHPWVWAAVTRHNYRSHN